MRILIISILIMVMYILQTALFTHIQFMGARPDLVLTVVLGAGISAGSIEGMTVGFLGGLLVDLFRGTFIGLSVPGKVLVGFLAGILPRKVYTDYLWVPVATAFLATIIDQGVFLLLGSSFGLQQPFWTGLRKFVYPSAFYTALLSPLIVYGVRNLYTDFRRRGWHKGQRLT